MKKTRLFLLSALTLVLILMLALPIALTACEQPGGGDVTTEAPPDESTAAPAVDINFVLDGNTDYTFVRPEDLSTELKDEMVSLYAAMSSAYNASKTLSIAVDWYKPGTDVSTLPAHEILVGQTNRAETTEAMKGLGEYDWIITIVGEKLVITGGNDESTLQAIRFFRDTFVNGKSSLVLSSDYSKVTIAPPNVLGSTPENYYHDFSTLSPVVKVDFYASPALDASKSTVSVDGTDITSQCTWTENSVTISGVTFTNGSHTADITLTDTKGNVYKHTQYFGCGETDTMNLYKGEVHAHTSDSDGQLTPTDAYKYARDVARLDFFAVTDHSNSCSSTVYLKQHIPVANSFNEPGKFVSLYGYEQTYNFATGFYGHLNSINNTSLYTTRDMGLENYYKASAATTDSIVQFNHPGYKWGNFLEYGLWNEEYDSAVNLYEFKGSGYDTEWALCLAHGWHVSPMHNEDNHSANWGTANEAVGYALSPALTRANIVEAMNLNRTYTTTDGTLKIYYKINDSWMGSRLDSPDKLDVTVSLTTSKATGLGNIYLIGEDNVIVASYNAGTKKTYDWKLTVDPSYDYYYIKVNGASGFAVTAPIWIENREELTISGLAQSLIVGSEDTKDHRVTATVKNNGTSAMTDVTVKFYISALGSVYQNTATPFATVNIGTLEAGKSAEASADASYALSTPRVTAVVTGKVGDKAYGATLYTMLTRTIITEIVPSTSGYSYIEIYNNTDSVVDLSTYKLVYYPKAGADATALSENTWTLSGSIQAHSAGVVWFRTSTSRTAADFNKFYSSSLEEGKNLIILNTTKIPATANPAQFELNYGSTVVSRIWYNWGADGNEAVNGKAVTYAYQTEFTLTEVKLAPAVAPTPGTYDASQVPAVISK